MKRRDFLKSTATLIGGAAVGGALHPGALMADAAPTKGGTLIWGHSETTQNLDIHQTGTASTIRVLQNVHCAIVTVDKNFNVIPSLAKSFEQSPDGLTYTFHLQPGVKFHNGKTMTAADVKYSFERCKNPSHRRREFRGVQRRRRDRYSRRNDGGHQDVACQRAVPQPPRREWGRRGDSHGLGRRAGQDADRSGAVQVHSA